MVKSFKELGLGEGFLNVIQGLKFIEPSEIQEKAIPLALAGKDIIGGSATGSGKTLAFGASILENIKKGQGIQALILTPTRELAEQVSRSLMQFSRFNPVRISPVYGGVSMLPQIENLPLSEIVVGTPGRILDHISRNTLNLSKIKYLILDEADRMLDMGFLDDVTRIISACPKERQTMLFSATISHDILGIAKDYMKNPVEVSVENQVDPKKLRQYFYDVPSNEKFSLLVHLLKNEESHLVMVFCNTKRSADFIGRQLKTNGINALSLHGDLSQNQRNRVLDQFHKSEEFVLVCTDVAARGLDIKNVSHVYNFDSPKTDTEYIHRIGRTARAGKEGKAITILGDRDYENFRRVKNNPDLEIIKLDPPSFEQVRLIHRPMQERGRDRGRSERGFRSFHRGDRGSSQRRGGPHSRDRDSGHSHARRHSRHEEYTPRFRF